MRWTKVTELKPIAIILDALGSGTQPVDARELCRTAELGRSACDRSLHILTARGLIRRSARGFGGSNKITLTEPGSHAAASASQLLELLRDKSMREAWTTPARRRSSRSSPSAGLLRPQWDEATWPNA